MQEIVGKSKVLVVGSPGIGKSMFLQRLLVHIVEQAQRSGAAIPSISYYCREMEGIKSFKLMNDGTVEIDDGTSMSAYVLSDSVDLHYTFGSVLTFLVASENETQYKRFAMAIGQSGAKGLNTVMPPFTGRELVAMKPESMSEEEALFRYDVYGGSARNFNFRSAATSAFQYHDGLEDLMSTLFPTTQVRFPVSWKDILTNISLEFSKKDIDIVVSSLIVHMGVDRQKIWASEFMQLLTATILNGQETSLRSTLKKFPFTALASRLKII